MKNPEEISNKEELKNIENEENKMEKNREESMQTQKSTQNTTNTNRSSKTKRKRRKKVEVFIPQKPTKSDVKFTLRIPARLHKEIADYAEKQDMSMNVLIINCIEFALDHKAD